MSPSYFNHDDNTLLVLLKTGDTAAFEAIYDRYVDVLYEYVDRRIRNKEDSKEIVQNVFEWLWSNRKSLLITSSVRSYFFGAAKHQLLNYLRSKRIQDKYITHFTQYMNGHCDHSTDEMMNLSDLEKSIERSISELPDKCQTIFRLSRMEHIPIQHIAHRMNISTRTVENYLTQALKHLRTTLEKVIIVIISIRIFLPF